MRKTSTVVLCATILLLFSCLVVYLLVDDIPALSSMWEIWALIIAIGVAKPVYDYYQERFYYDDDDFQQQKQL